MDVISTRGLEAWISSYFSQEGEWVDSACLPLAGWGRDGHPDQLRPSVLFFCASLKIRKWIKSQDTEWENILVIHANSKNISKDMNEAKNSYRLMREIQGTQLKQVNEGGICFRKRVASWPISYEHTNGAQFYQQLRKCTLKTSDVQMGGKHKRGFRPHCWRAVCVCCPAALHSCVHAPPLACPFTC